MVEVDADTVNSNRARDEMNAANNRDQQSLLNVVNNMTPNNAAANSLNRICSKVLTKGT